MLYIGLLTYRTDNLAISLPTIKKYYDSNQLIVHNDCPNFPIDLGKDIKVINEQFNQGMLQSRLNILASFDESKLSDEDVIIFMDDDDIMFPFEVPAFDTPKYMSKNITCTRLAEMFIYQKLDKNELLDYIKDNISDHEVIPNWTIARSLFKLKDLIKFVKIFNRYLPTIKSILGYDIINGGEDDILDQCYHAYVKYILKQSYCTEGELIVCAWNRVEDRVYRYNSDPIYGPNPEGRLVKFQRQLEVIVNGFPTWYEQHKSEWL